MRKEKYRYTVHIMAAEEGGFVVEIPAIQGHTQAETYEDAIQRAEGLVDFYIQSAIEHDEPIARDASGLCNTVSLQVDVPAHHE